jgi:hypothetical protein
MQWRHLCLALVAGCAPAFDPDRTDSDPGTFGHHVVDLLCKRLAWEATPSDVSGALDRDTCHGGDLRADAPISLVALVGDRPRSVTAIDLAVPPATTDALQAYLTSDQVLSLYDDDTMSTSIQSLGNLLSELGEDPDAMAALARFGARDGYRHPDVALGQLSSLVSSPQIIPALDSLLPAIVEGGAAHDAWTQLIAATGATLASASPATDPDRASAIAGKLLLGEDPEVATGTPQFVVRRDDRGVARVALAAPFVDTDQDGLPDIDALGRYVDAGGNVLPVATPFAAPGDTSVRDANGLSTDVPYTYLDLDRTIVGALARDATTLLDPAHGTALDLVRGASLLLGDRAAQTHTFDDGSTLAYTGYDTSDAPLLDIAYAFIQLLGDANADDTLALAAQLFSSHQAMTARLVENMIATARLGDMFPMAQILDNAPLWDDMRPLLAKITADPKLVHDLLVALERPEVAQLGTRFQEFMTYNDRFDIASDQSLTGAFTTMPDRSKPDSDFNRSLWQRLLNVISDSNGAHQCNKQGAQLKQSGLVVATYNACQLFEIPNLAVFYLQSIAYAKDANGNVICEDNGGAFDATKTAATGEACAAYGAGWRPRPKANFNYNWNQGLSSTLVISLLGGDAYVESNATITGFRTHPTPEALNRVLFLDPTPQAIQDTADPMRDKDGDLFKVQHAGTLPVWENNNFYAEIRPIVQAFADANQEQTFVDIMSVLHEHWSSAASTSTQHTDPNAGNYTFGSNAVSYEPFVIAVLGGDLYPALTQSAAELVGITANSKPMTQIVAHAGNYLVSPQPGLTDRLGHTTTSAADGTPVPVLSPWHLLADAFLHKRARLAAAGADAARWTDSISELADLLMRGDATPSWHFRNPHFAATSRAFVQMLRDRLAVHSADRAQWLATVLPGKLEDTLTHPVAAAAADLITALEGAPRTNLESLLASVLDPAQPSFATLRASTAEMLQLARDDRDLVPVARVTGRLLQKDYLPIQLALFEKLHAADGAHTLNDLVARLFQPIEPGVPVISAIADGVGDVDRIAPATVGPWDAADYANVFHVTGDFLREQQHGLLRFIAIVKGRNP